MLVLVVCRLQVAQNPAAAAAAASCWTMAKSPMHPPSRRNPTASDPAALTACTFPVLLLYHNSHTHFVIVLMHPHPKPLPPCRQADDHGHLLTEQEATLAHQASFLTDLATKVEGLNTGCTAAQEGLCENGQKLTEVRMWEMWVAGREGEGRPQRATHTPGTPPRNNHHYQPAIHHPPKHHHHVDTALGALDQLWTVHICSCIYVLCVPPGRLTAHAKLY